MARDQLSEGALTNLASSFAGQEHTGILAGLLLRLARFTGGDPSGTINVQSTGVADIHGLPDNTPAQSAVIYVSGGPIFYRVDGIPPAAAGDQVIAAGSTVTLTGKPTMRAFQFCSATAAVVTLFGTYYD